MAAYNPAVDSPSMAVSTRDNLNRGEWFSELQTYRRYPMCELLIYDGVAKERTGKKLTFRAADDPGTPKPRTTPYTTYTADKHANAYEGFVYWRHGRETCAIDKAEQSMNSGEAMVIDETELEMQHMYVRACDSIETACWTVPGPSDTLNEAGIPYYITCPTTANGGFLGTVPTSGHTTVAGLDPVTAHPKYRNYADLYTDFTHDDFGLKVSKMFRAIDFDPPPKGKDDGTTIDAMRIYMGDATMSEWELMAISQNDQLGNDALPMFGKSILKGIAPTAIPVLDSLANANSMPIYFVNHYCLYPVFLTGWRFKEEGPLDVPMSDMIHWKISFKYNWEGKSRRRQAVLAKAAPFGEA